jgi:hypothetical protein
MQEVMSRPSPHSGDGQCAGRGSEGPDIDTGPPVSDDVRRRTTVSCRALLPAAGWTWTASSRPWLVRMLDAYADDELASAVRSVPAPVELPPPALGAARCRLYSAVGDVSAAEALARSHQPQRRMLPARAAEVLSIAGVHKIVLAAPHKIAWLPAGRVLGGGGAVLPVRSTTFVMSPKAATRRG